MKTEDIALLVSVISMLGTVITFFFYDKRIKAQEKKINAFQLKKFVEEEEENKKAELRATVYQTGHNRKIKVYNRGKACAKNVNLLFPEDHPLLLTNSPFPIEYMHSQDFNELVVHLRTGTKNKIEVVITWDDDFGTNRRHEQILQLY